ncbi:MAG: phosphopyruvate hydratase [Euryarchaeota archaeon]|nr:phosphopyruvate hydratase [Euryarchaeota archaeon]
MTLIESIEIRKILDSRGNPTVEVDVYTIHGFGRAAAPAGKSTGIHEVKAYPPGGIDAGIKFLKEHMDNFIGMDATMQSEIDAVLHEIDQTPNFSRLGGNIAVALSLAVAKAAASSLGMSLYRYLGGAYATDIPKPVGNVLGGGKHAINGTSIQEMLSAALSDSAQDNVFANAKVHAVLGKKLRKRFPDLSIGLGDEKAWVAPLSDEEAVALVREAVDEVHDETGIEIQPALDFAASSFYENGKYVYRNKTLSTEEQIEFVEKLVKDYGIYIVEDPLHEEDFDGFAELTRRIGHMAYVVGDDIFVTNTERIKIGIDKGAANTVLIKPNQIGTLTDTFRAVKLAKEHGYACMISHRSGETCDTSIAHLGVAFGCEFIKTGTIGGERIAKLNELIRIEEEIKGEWKW